MARWIDLFAGKVKAAIDEASRMGIPLSHVIGELEAQKHFLLVTARGGDFETREYEGKEPPLGIGVSDEEKKTH